MECSDRSPAAPLVLRPVSPLTLDAAVNGGLAPAARVELDAHAFAQDAAVGAGIRSQGRTLLDPVDREILNVVSTGFPSESAPEEESPFEHEYAADVSLIQVVEGTNG